MEINNTKNRPINLYSPSLTKLVRITAWEEDQKLDLGSIARAFGVDPSSLKLNGHFISRGVDHIACSVTWRSLLSFFSARGLGTGLDGPGPGPGSGAVVVDGKVLKSGCKRQHFSSEVENGVRCNTQDINSLTNKKLKENKNEWMNEENQDSRLKRKNWLENMSIGNFKKPKVFGTASARSTKLFCRYKSEKSKRVRDEDVIVAASYKRTR